MKSTDVREIATALLYGAFALFGVLLLMIGDSSPSGLAGSTSPGPSSTRPRGRRPGCWDLVYHLGPERGLISMDSESLVIRLNEEEPIRQYRIVVP